MTTLTLHGREVGTVFELLGRRENDLTYSLGWALARSPAFLSAFVRLHVPKGTRAPGGEWTVRLQTHGHDGGYTDVEIIGTAHDAPHLIVEAKAGWNLPGENQLERYAGRFASGSTHAALVALSNCAAAYASRHLPAAVRGHRVLHRSWAEVAGLARSSATAADSHAEKRLLREFADYLQGSLTMQKEESNLVYVVALAAGAPEWSTLPWIDIVGKARRYFHPVGGSGWPKEPPNYMGFRYHGRLQAVRHVGRFHVTEDLSEHVEGIHQAKWLACKPGPHFVYELGPAITPPHEVRTGGVYRSGRVWAAIDLLLTAKTIAEARDKTHKRLARAL